jgi:hypothetical protein
MNLFQHALFLTNIWVIFGIVCSREQWHRNVASKFIIIIITYTQPIVNPILTTSISISMLPPISGPHYRKVQFLSSAVFGFNVLTRRLNTYFPNVTVADILEIIVPGPRWFGVIKLSSIQVVIIRK